MNFIRRVVLYKIIGAFAWSVFFNNILLGRFISLSFQLFGCEYVYEFELLSLAALPFLMLSYIRTLKNIPTSTSLLHLSEFANIIFWLFCYWSYLFLVASAAIEPPISFVVCTLVFIFEVKRQNHALYFTFQKQTRFQRFCNAFNSHIILTLILGVIFYFVRRLSGFLSVVQLFLSSDVIFAITTVIASEPVSFASRDNKRFLNGLKSSDQYERYLAFQDLYSISSGNKLRRRFLFTDPSGHIFSIVVDTSAKLMISFCHRQEKLLQMGNSRKPIHRVNDSQWRRSQINRQAGLQYEIIKQKPSVFQRIINFFSFKEDPMKNERLVRESDALELSTLSLLSIQSLVKIIFILPSEDNYGIGQKYAEKILDILLTTKSFIDQTSNYAFISPDFPDGWFVSNPMDLALKVKETVDWGVSEILKNFPSQLDYSKLSPKNLQLTQRLLGRKL